MNNFMNNPFMDMFKQSSENPMSMWSKFNPSNWIEEAGKMAENFPWLKSCGFNPQHHTQKAFSFDDHAKGMKALSELSQLALENTQAMMYRQAEIIQRHSSELYKAIQDISSSSNHVDNMERQQEYMRACFQAMTNDLKELAEMYSKASLETFDAASGKVAECMNNNCPKEKRHHNTSDDKHNEKSTNHSKAYRSNKK